MSCESRNQIEAIEEGIQGLARAVADRDKTALIVAELVAEKASAELRIQALQAIPDDSAQQAWCADFTENLSGEVATAEIPGEGNEWVIIRPGYNSQSVYSAIRDGQLFHRAGQSPEQAFFNAAILPGWQKWMPTYRVGTLTAINTSSDTGSVNLDVALSSANDLPINQTSTITGVPIVYMDCNAEAFQFGDRVLVEFLESSWESPRIIGFASNPRECPPPEVEIIWPPQLVLLAKSRSLELVGGTGRGQETEPQDGFGGVRARTYNGKSVHCLPNPNPMLSGLPDSAVTVRAEFVQIDGEWLGYDAGIFNELPDVFLHADGGGPLSIGSSSGASLDVFGTIGAAYHIYSETTFDWASSLIECPDGVIPGLESGLKRAFTGGDTFQAFRDDMDDFGALWSRLAMPATVTLTHTASGETRTYQESGFAESPGPGPGYGATRKYVLVDPE